MESRWPAELDALVAAPDHHFLIFENDRVRVIETRVEPGGLVPLHTHRWPCVQHVQHMDHFVRRSESGEVLLDSRSGEPRPDGWIGWGEPLPPHTFENVGTTTIRVISIEIKEST